MRERTLDFNPFQSNIFGALTNLNPGQRRDQRSIPAKTTRQIPRHATIHALAALLGREFQALNPVNGVEAPPRIAWIDESRCIGCARCLPPCPVDAIVGAAKFMHTVLAERCTGCELCVAPCPVDCIEMRPAPTSAPMTHQPSLNRTRYNAHTERIVRRAEQRQRELDAKKAAASRPAPIVP